MKNEINQLKADLPTHLTKLENYYNVNLAKLSTYKRRTRYYYDHLKHTQDVYKQLEFNRTLAKTLGLKV